MKKNQQILKKNKVGRPTKAVSDQQIQEVAVMLLSAKSRTEIIDYCVQNYGIKEVSVANIVTNAYKWISETHKVDRDGLVHAHIEHYYSIYAMAKALGDSRGAIQALNSIEKLLKITADVQIQNNTLNLNLKDLSTNDLKTLLNIQD